MGKLTKNSIIFFGVIVLICGCVLFISPTQKQDEYLEMVVNDAVQLNRIFLSDLKNPDAGLEEGNSVLGVELENVAAYTFWTIDFVVTTTDKKRYPFKVEYLPAGEKIWAYATNNASAQTVEGYAGESVADYARQSTMKEDIFDVTEEGCAITVTNISKQRQSDIMIYYHCRKGDVLYGGIAYRYPIDELDIDSSVTFFAPESIGGDVEVVCIECGEE